MSEQVLHVYETEGGEEWYVAASEEDARRIWFEATGEEPEHDYEQLPDDRELTIRDEDAPGGRVTQTCREWAAQCGRGCLASIYA